MMWEIMRMEARQRRRASIRRGLKEFFGALVLGAITYVLCVLVFSL